MMRYYFTYTTRMVWAQSLTVLVKNITILYLIKTFLLLNN